MKGKYLVNLKKDDEAIEFYNNNNILDDKYKKNELGLIYFNKKKYEIAFKYFDEIDEFHHAFKSLKNTKPNNISKIIDYANQIYLYLGLREYVKTYKTYINQYLEIFFKF